MELAPHKQRTLDRLNEEGKANYEEAFERALRAGKAPPPPFAPLTPEQVEYPKWLYRGWQATKDREDGHQSPAASKLVKTEAEATELLAKGWSEEPPKPTKK